MESNNYEDWKITQLKDACKRRGILIKPNAKRDFYINQLKDYDRSGSPVLFDNKNYDVFQKKQDNNNYVSKRKVDTIIRYLQLNISNVSDYFNAGIIYPLALEESQIYKNQNRSNDIINQFERCLLVTEGILNEFSESEVLLELIIKLEEYTKLEGLPVGYIEVPLPISRVKNLYFISDSVKSKFLASVKAFPDCYIPETICQVLINKVTAYKLDLNSINVQPSLMFSEWQEKLSFFDRFMGLFSFMKNSGLIYAEKDNQLKEISNTFIGALCEINSTAVLPKREDKVFQAVFIPDKPVHFKSESQRYIFKQTLNSIFSDHVFSVNSTIKIIEEAIKLVSISQDEKTDLLEIINHFRDWETRKVSYQSLLEIEKIRKYLPVIILLYLAKFPAKSQQSSDKQSVRVSIIDNQKYLSKSFTEYILAILGLYYGYKSMVKNDTNLIFIDEKFSRIADSVQSIKFKLDSYFDRFVIESIYQFVKLGKPISDDFNYLKINTNTAEINLPNETHGEFTYNNKSAFLLDKKIITIERISRQVSIMQSIVDKYPDKVNIHYHLVFFLLEKFGIAKTDLIEIIKKNEHKISLDELDSIINLDKNK